jgi:hypothetical protein
VSPSSKSNESAAKENFETGLEAPAPDRRALALVIRQAIVGPKAEYPPFSLREIAAICRHRFERPAGLIWLASNLIRR